MKTSEMKSKTIDELKQLTLELLREQFNLRMQKVPGQVVKSHLLQNVRKRIAQVKTIISEKSR